MNYTDEQIDLFERMFEISSEHTCYTGHRLTPQGLEEGKPDDFSYNTGSAHITLSNSNKYSIDFGDSNDAEGIAFDAFSEFIHLNYDEALFEQYLINESIFTLT